MAGDLDESEDVLTVDEAAVLLRIGRNALYEAIARNEVPYRRIGRRKIRLSRRGLLHWLSCGHLQVAKEGQ